RTGRTRWGRNPSTTAAGRRATTAACARGSTSSTRPNIFPCCCPAEPDHTAPRSLITAPVGARERAARRPGMRVRARYAKEGRLRFGSAIDLGRIWERALRKADLPIGYSEGFTPHPKVSFPDALPLGY